MKVIVKAYSKSSVKPTSRIATLILEYPRFIHAELMTHRIFSRNAASSRAIPTKAIIQDIRDNPAKAVWWGKAMSGMQAKVELTGWRLMLAKAGWAVSRELAILMARVFSAIGLHKQLANRILEPFQNIRVVVTSTQWNNFFALRNHPDAQPEFGQLARLINTALSNATPRTLAPGQWHIPYIETHENQLTGEQYFNDWNDETKMIEQITLEQALKVSASMAAQESYRKSDNSLTKAEAIWLKLVDSAPVHASPTEHQAQLMEFRSISCMPRAELGTTKLSEAWRYMQSNKGITHLDRQDNFWSGNFKGWVQHRQLIPNHDVPG